MLSQMYHYEKHSVTLTPEVFMPKKQMHLCKFYNCLVKDSKPVYPCMFIVLGFFSHVNAKLKSKEGIMNI